MTEITIFVLSLLLWVLVGLIVLQLGLQLVELILRWKLFKFEREAQ